MRKSTHGLYTTCVQNVHMLGTTLRKSFNKKLRVDNHPYLYQSRAQSLPHAVHSLARQITPVIYRPFHTIHTPYKETKIYKLTNINTSLSGEL